MGFYKQREDFFRTIAEVHPTIAHDQPLNDGTNDKRLSFFRINGLEELEAACKNFAHMPCLVHFELSGKDINKDGSIRQQNSNAVLVLTTVDENPNDPIFAAALTDAYDLTFDIVLDIKKAVADEYEENDGCGVFQYLEQAFGSWDRFGPVGDDLYGHIFKFTDETIAYQ